MMYISSLKGWPARQAHALTALGLLLATAGAAQAQTPATFAAVATASPGTGTSPQGVAVADVNADGRPDVLTANSNGTVSVLLGNGSGGFTLSSSPSTGTSSLARTVVVADMNLDGKPDLLTANTAANSVSFLVGNGSGGFTLAATLSTGTTAGTFTTAPYDLVVADVNRDGKPDIVTANSGNSSVGLLLGNGSGGFTLSPRIVTGTEPRGAVVVDANRDGKPDIYVVEKANNTSTYLQGDGNGGFSAQGFRSVPASPTSVTTADVNGDGRVDIVIANKDNDQVNVLLNDVFGEYNLVASPSTGAGSQPQDVAVADVNGDGKLDILTANTGTNTVGVLLNNGSGGFTLQTPSLGSGTGALTDVAAADVNGDGRPDVLATNAGNNTVEVLLNTTPVAPRILPPATTYGTGAGTEPLGLTVADVNRDGKPDVLTANQNNNTLGVLLNNGTGGFTLQTPSPSTINGGGSLSRPVAVAVGDLNLDGRPDAVTANSSNGTISVFQGNGSGSFTLVSYFFTTDAPGSVAVADVNGDGKPDILTASNFSGTLSVLLNNGSGLFILQATRPSTGGNAQNLEVVDVNGDGKLDVLTANSNTRTLGVLLGDGSGGFTLASTPGTGGTFTIGLAVADVNGDGKLDALTTNLGTSTVGVLLGNGSGGFTLASTPGTGTGTRPGDVAVADVNGDGKPDLLTANTGTSTVSVLLNNGSGGFTLSVSPSAGPGGTPQNLAVADVNGDGQPDVLTGNYSSNTVGVLLSSPLPDLVVNTGTLASPTTIPAGTYNSITVNSPGVATLADNVTVFTSTTVNDGATLNSGCFVLSGAGTFTLAAGGTLGICDAAGIAASGATGSIQTTGTRTFSTDASYVYNGTAAQSTGTGLPGRVRNLRSNNSTLTLAAPTSVAQVLTVGFGNLATGGNALTLLSSAAGTALIVNLGGGRVIGSTVAVQRYIDPSLNPGRGYRHYSSPVSNSTVADLTTTGFAPVLTQSYNTSATPDLTTPFPNVFGYDQDRVSLTNTYAPFDRGFVVPAGLNAPLVVGQGYAVNIAGTELVDFVGTPNNGSFTYSAARTSPFVPNAGEAGWNLVGNPYPAPLDYSLLAANSSNLDNAMYVFESAGPYTGSYRPYVNGIPAANRYLASGQGFFVRVQVGQSEGLLNFDNTQRLTDYATQVPFRRTAPDPRPLVQLELRGATGPADALYAYAETGATPAFDSQFDAEKLPNSTGLNLSSAAATGERLAIDGRPAFTAATVLPLHVGVPAAGTYAFTAAALTNLPAGLDAYLTDALTGQTVNLRTQPSYTFTLSTAQIQATITGRFTLRFAASSPLATAPALTAAEVSVYPNPARARFTVLMPGVAGATAVQAELLNALGQVVRRQSATLPATGTTLQVEATGLATGVYTLRLLAGPTAVAKRVVIE